MIAWLIGIAYWVIAFVLFRFVTLPNGMRNLDDSTRVFSYEDTKQRWRDENRGWYVAGALVMAIFWPVAAPFSLAWNAITSSKAALTPAEIQREQREEIERLRKLAKEYGLPLGNDDSTT